MNKSKVRNVIIAACGVIMLAGLTAAGTREFRITKGMEILVNMFRDLSLFYVDEPEPDKLLSDAAMGMTRSLDPYTEFISEEDMSSFEVMTTGRYGGVGALIRQKDDWVIFAEPYEGSPADLAGIVIGDKILEIGGDSAKGMSTAQVSSLLKGDPGTSVKLKIEKFYTGGVETLKIKREIISLPGIPYYGMVSDSVGYILHRDFTQDCSNDMRNAVMELKAAGARSLVLDYRNNGGGIMQEAVKILSFFVPKGTEVVSMRGRTQETSASFVTQNEPLDTTIPIVALVNSGSASAAEIVAGAIQDLDRGVVMGKRTFGKGLVQSTRPLGYNSYLKLTTAKYYLPSGRCIQALDYAKRDEDGVISYIPDSLITQYSTAAGRKVYDGGGVMPDVRFEHEYVSRFAFILYSRGYISDFADIYVRANLDKEVVPGQFAITEADYDDFIDFMKDKDVQWESETKQALRILREKARQERYLDGIAESLTLAEAGISDDKEDNLILHKEELTDYIEGEIILRRRYARGVSAHNTTRDKEVAAAATLLDNRVEYRKILESKDTERK